MTRPLSARLLLAALMLGFFAFWMRDLGLPAFSGDEAFVAIQSQKTAGEIVRQLNIDEPHPPLYYLAMRGWHVATASLRELPVRTPSLLSGLLLLSVTYALGRRLGLGRLVAFIPVLLVGLNPQITVHVREARMYGPMLVTAVFAYLVASRFERMSPVTSMVAVMLSTLLALLTHYFNALFMAGLAMWGLLNWTGALRRRWLAAQAGAWLLLAVWLPFFGRGFFSPETLEAGKTWSLRLRPWETLAELIEVGAFGNRFLPAAGWVVVAAGLLMVAGWLAGCWLAKGGGRLLLLSAVVVPVGLFAMLAWIRPVFHAKYTLPWLVFAALGPGFVTATRRRTGIALTAALLGLTAGATWRTVESPYDPGLPLSGGDALSPNARLLGEGLAALAGPDDTYGECAPNPAHDFYTNDYLDRPLGYAVLPHYPEQPAAELSGQLEALLGSHRLLWYLDCTNPFWDPERVADQAFESRALLLGVEEIAGDRVRLYVAPGRVLEEQQVVGARFGGDPLAELSGTWKAKGQSLYVVLVWRSLAQTPDVDAKVFVHLVDGGGQPVSQSDGVPVAWTRPLATWRQDELLLDVHALPAPGADASGYTLRVGLYDAQTLDRLPAVDAQAERAADDAILIPPGGW